MKIDLVKVAFNSARGPHARVLRALDMQLALETDTPATLLLTLLRPNGKVRKVAIPVDHAAKETHTDPTDGSEHELWRFEDDAERKRRREAWEADRRDRWEAAEVARKTAWDHAEKVRAEDQAAEDALRATAFTNALAADEARHAEAEAQLAAVNALVASTEEGLASGAYIAGLEVRMADATKRQAEAMLQLEADYEHAAAECAIRISDLNTANQLELLQLRTAQDEALAPLLADHATARLQRTAQFDAEMKAIDDERQQLKNDNAAGNAELQTIAKRLLEDITKMRTEVDASMAEAKKLLEEESAKRIEALTMGKQHEEQLLTEEIANLAAKREKLAEEGRQLVAAPADEVSPAEPAVEAVAPATSAMDAFSPDVEFPGEDAEFAAMMKNVNAEWDGTVADGLEPKRTDSTDDDYLFSDIEEETHDEEPKDAAPKPSKKAKKKKS